MPRILKADLPKVLTTNHDPVIQAQINMTFKGLSYSTCVAGWTPEDKTIGHAHNCPFCPKYGWICVRQKTLIKDTQLLRHELAHLLTGQGHNEAWRKMVIKLGGHLEEYSFKYDKRRPSIDVPCYHKECRIKQRSTKT
jgi:hypothetical protein